MDSLQRQVLEFEIPDETFNPNFIPENGIQYLQQVFFERTKCPAVVYKPIQSDTILNDENNSNNMIIDMEIASNNLKEQESNNIPIALRPTEEWKEIQINEFNRIRTQINDLRPRFTIPATATRLPDSRTEWRQFCEHNEPLLSTMLRIDQRCLETLLDHQLVWLTNEQDDDDDDEEDNDVGDNNDAVDDKKDQPNENINNNTEIINWTGRWIYSTLGCLHLPLEPNVHSLLRNIARICLKLRNNLTTEEFEFATPLNLIVCIISRSFSQIDLENEL